MLARVYHSEEAAGKGRRSPEEARSRGALLPTRRRGRRAYSYGIPTRHASCVVDVALSARRPGAVTPESDSAPQTGGLTRLTLGIMNRAAWEMRSAPNRAVRSHKPADSCTEAAAPSEARGVELDSAGVHCVGVLASALRSCAMKRVAVVCTAYEPKLHADVRTTGPLAAI
jgi:hypothetical protein